MIDMTRREHYQRAKALLAGVDTMGRVSPRQARAVLTESDREALALASVHATLASVPAEVAGEAVELGTPERVLSADDVARDHSLAVRLEKALEELKAQTPMVSGSYAATFIRERVLGGEARGRVKPDPEGYVAVTELKEALEELERLDPPRGVDRAQWAAGFIRERVLGGEEGR